MLSVSVWKGLRAKRCCLCPRGRLSYATSYYGNICVCLDCTALQRNDTFLRFNLPFVFHGSLRREMNHHPWGCEVVWSISGLFSFFMFFSFMTSRMLWFAKQTVCVAAACLAPSKCSPAPSSPVISHLSALSPPRSGCLNKHTAKL